MAEEQKIKVAGAKKFKDYIFAVGRRREAIARVRLYSKVPSGMKAEESEVKKGSIIINDKKIDEYFIGKVAKVAYENPLKVTETLGKYLITVKVKGGGNKSQLEAFVHGLSRCFALVDEKNKQILRKKGLLTRDPRVRERRKVGMGGKARRKRQSPKR